jgi:hypothetical protein
MKLLHGIGVVIGLVTSLTAAGDVAGTWRAEFPGPGGATAVETLTLAVKNADVTGTLTNAVGGVGQIRDGKWDGATLRFWVPWDPGKLEASGRLVGPNLEMQFKTSQWTAARVFKPVPPKK